MMQLKTTKTANFHHMHKHPMSIQPNCFWYPSYFSCLGMALHHVRQTHLCFHKLVYLITFPWALKFKENVQDMQMLYVWCLGVLSSFSNWILVLKNFRQLAFISQFGLSLEIAPMLKCYISISYFTPSDICMRCGTKYISNVLSKRPNTVAFMKTIYSFIIYSDKNTLLLWVLLQSKSISTSTLFWAVLQDKNHYSYITTCLELTLLTSTSNKWEMERDSWYMTVASVFQKW